MTKLTNSQWREQLESHVEEHIQVAVLTFQNFDEEKLAAPALNGGWSITQCLWHLNSYGQYYFPLIESAINGKELLDNELIFKSGWLGEYFTKMMSPSPRSKKMKAFKMHIPPNSAIPQLEVAEFIRQQELLLKLLRVAANCDLNKIRIPISIGKVIRLKLGDVFQFIVAHDERHLQQARRNMFK